MAQDVGQVAGIGSVPLLPGSFCAMRHAPQQHR